MYLKQSRMIAKHHDDRRSNTHLKVDPISTKQKVCRKTASIYTHNQPKFTEITTIS